MVIFIKKHLSEFVLLLMLIITISITFLLTYYSNNKYSNNTIGNLITSLPSVNTYDGSTNSYLVNSEISISNTSLTTTSNSIGSSTNSRNNTNSNNSVSSSNSQGINSVSSLSSSITFFSSSSVSTVESPSAIIAFYSDNQSDTDEEDNNHTRVVNNILSTGVNTVFNAGDIMEDGTEASLDRFNTVTTTLRSSRTFYSALGNNDRVYGDSSTPSQLFLDNFEFPNNEKWYSVNIGNLHMVILDSVFNPNDLTQLNWLTSDLSSIASQSRITGVMYHYPTYSTTIASYLIDNNADFVVTGHTHTYAHSSSNGINYFTTSGQPNIGYLLASVYSDKAIIKYYNQNNSLIETIEFNER